MAGRRSNRRIRLAVPPPQPKLSFEFDLHAVEGRFDVRWQFGAQLRKIEIAVHVGEDRAFGLDAVDPLQRQIEMEMARMRPIPQRVYDPQLDSMQGFDGSLGHIDEIG